MLQKHTYAPTISRTFHGPLTSVRKATKNCAWLYKHRIRQPSGSFFCACIARTPLILSQFENLPTLIMARTPPFSSLPYEIVSQICRQPDLDKDDMIALRLTCKSYGVHDAATRSFGKLFEDITVLFSEHSFNMLINICKHPVFSHCIRSVKLSSIRCNKHESLQTTMNLLGLGDLLSNHPAGLDARLQALDKLSARIRSYTLRTRHESDLSRSNKPVELLTLALKCLSRSGDRIALGIAIDETNGLGCGRVLCAKDVFSNLWYNTIYSTLEVLATAVSDANYSFGKLNVDTRAMDSFHLTSFRRRTIDPTILTMFSRVEELDLQAFYSHQRNSDHDLASLVAEVLSKPTQLKVLRVLGADTPGWKWSASNLGNLRCISSARSLFLESLSLIGIETTTSLLRTLLAGVQQTLRYLRIDKCQTRNDTLQPVIVLIKDHLAELDELHITHVSVISQPEDIYRWWDPEPKDEYESGLLACINAYGQEDIQSSLAEVLLGYENRPAIMP
ncbi:hypothetical protein KCU92_g7125, partial [Aureobasidium melanogenum]|jgi:hypothetical protein